MGFEKLLPFLVNYPPWVRGYFILCMVMFVVFAAVLLFVPRKDASENDRLMGTAAAVISQNVGAQTAQIINNYVGTSEVTRPSGTTPNTTPPPPGPPTPSGVTIENSAGPVVWDFNRQFILIVGGNAVVELLFQGTSSSPTNISEAYVISGLTGHRQDVVANVQTPGKSGYYPVTAVSIPPQAPVMLDLILDKPPYDASLSFDDFLKQWGRFTFYVNYTDGSQFQASFNENYMRKRLAMEVPSAFGPQVTPK